MEWNGVDAALKDSKAKALEYFVLWAESRDTHNGSGRTTSKRQLPRSYKRGIL